MRFPLIYYVMPNTPIPNAVIYVMNAECMTCHKQVVYWYQTDDQKPESPLLELCPFCDKRQ